MSVEQNFEIDRKEWFELKAMVREVYGFVFGNSDQRYDHDTARPLFYAMPDVTTNLQKISAQLEDLNRGRWWRDILLTVSLVIGTAALLTSIWALVLALSGR